MAQKKSGSAFKQVISKVTKGSNSKCCSSQGFDQGKLNEMIQKKAYYIWQEKGCPSGRDEENWLEAESQIKKCR